MGRPRQPSVPPAPGGRLDRSNDFDRDALNEHDVFDFLDLPSDGWVDLDEPSLSHARTRIECVIVGMIAGAILTVLVRALEPLLLGK